MYTIGIHFGNVQSTGIVIDDSQLLILHFVLVSILFISDSIFVM